MVYLPVTRLVIARACAVAVLAHTSFACFVFTLSTVTSLVLATSPRALSVDARYISATHTVIAKASTATAIFAAPTWTSCIIAMP